MQLSLEEILEFMVLAAYLHKDADPWVRRIARRFAHTPETKEGRHMLRTVLKSPYPSKLVLLAHEEVYRDSLHTHL